MMYSFRGVNLGVVGTCVGVNDKGDVARVIVPATIGGRQLVNVSISVEPCDASWSAGVISVRRMNHPEAEPVDFASAVTITSSDKLKHSSSLSVDAAYVALVVTTANASTACVDLHINVSDNV